MRIPAERCPTHPGVYIKEDLIEEMDISQTELAKRLFVSRRTINQIVNFKRSITTDMAIRLGFLTRTSPEMWVNMQSAYDLWNAKQDFEKAGTVKIEPITQEASTAVL